MKRVTSTRELDALKPVFGSRGQPPFYDPNDLHSHVWFKGKLGIEDNPKVPTYNNAKLNIRDCVYCKICHKIRDDFQSTVGDNKDVLENPLEAVISSEKPESYQYQTMPPLIDDEKVFEDVPVSKEESKKPKLTNGKLFLNSEGIFDDYLVVLKNKA